MPGETPRHAEGFFDRFKHFEAADDLAASEAWIMGCALARDGFYWEAHELWEAVWMACPPAAPDRVAVQAAIQLVNAALKRRMGRDRAVARLCAEAERLRRDATQRGARLGLSDADWEWIAAQAA